MGQAILTRAGSSEFTSRQRGRKPMNKEVWCAEPFTRCEYRTMTRKFLVGMAVVLVVQSTAAAQQQGTRNGAVIGGVSGAVIGGIIGKQNDEIPEGALIGGAVGAVAGGLLVMLTMHALARINHRLPNIITTTTTTITTPIAPCLRAQP